MSMIAIGMTIIAGTIEIETIATEIVIAIAITAAGAGTTGNMTVIVTTVSTAEPRADTATTVITSTSKPNSKAIRTDFTLAPVMLNVARVTTHNVLTTTETQIPATTLRTAIEASFNRLIGRDSCRATSRDISSTEATTETTAVAGRGNVTKQTVSLRLIV